MYDPEFTSKKDNFLISSRRIIFRKELNYLEWLIVLTIENEEEIFIRICFFLLFAFYAKSVTTKNHRTGMSDIS